MSDRRTMGLKKSIWGGTVFTVGLICLLCSGCSRDEAEKQDVQDTSASVESETEYVTETDSSEDKQSLPIPRNKQEEEELFGTTNEAGQWIPPEGFYVDPKTGVIFNKEGGVIGNTKPPEYFQAHPGKYG